MIPIKNQNLQSFLPLYNFIPEEWRDARNFFIENLRRISGAVNAREIGYFLNIETATGKQFIPGLNDIADGGTSQQLRTIMRKVIVFPGLTVGVNTQPHGIVVDANFTLIDMFGGATDATLLTGNPLPNGGATISYDATNVYVTVGKTFTRAFITMEYVQEL